LHVRSNIDFIHNQASTLLFLYFKLEFLAQNFLSNSIWMHLIMLNKETCLHFCILMLRITDIWRCSLLNGKWCMCLVLNTDVLILELCIKYFIIKPNTPYAIVTVGKCTDGMQHNYAKKCFLILMLSWYLSVPELFIKPAVLLKHKTHFYLLRNWYTFLSCHKTLSYTFCS